MNPVDPNAIPDISLGNDAPVVREEDEFNVVCDWALQEEQKSTIRKTQGFGISNTYIFILVVLIFLIVLFILYLANRRRGKTALEMIRDPNNVFDEFSQNNDDNNTINNDTNDESGNEDEKADEKADEKMEGKIIKGEKKLKKNKKEKEIPMIDLSDEVLPVSEEPNIENMVEPNTIKKEEPLNEDTNNENENLKY